MGSLSVCDNMSEVYSEPNLCYCPVDIGQLISVAQTHCSDLSNIYDVLTSQAESHLVCCLIDAVFCLGRFEGRDALPLFGDALPFLKS